MKAILLILCLLFIASPAVSRTWYVTPDSTGDAPTIQAAVDSASPGDDVLLAPGLYNSENQDPWTVIGSMIEMKSGVWLHSESGPAVTVLDGAYEGGRLIECYSVSGGAVIEGLTIMRGVEIQDGGGGIYCEGSTVTIRNNVFVGNQTSGVWEGSGKGGGVHLFSSDGEITGNTFVGNYADQGGASIGCDAYSYPTISQNIISGSEGSGALYCHSLSSPLVVCNAFWDNEAGDGDCALAQDNFSADPLFCDSESGNYRLREDSPCGPGYSPSGCGLIGAMPVGCWGVPIGSMVVWLISLGLGTVGASRIARVNFSQDRLD